MNRYELTYIIDTALEENARKELIEKFSALIAQNGGEVEKVDETWGKRRLAYAINDKPEGYYVLVTFKGPSEPAPRDRAQHGHQRGRPALPHHQARREEAQRQAASRAPRGACGRACRSCRGSRSRCRAACRNPRC